MLNYIKELRKKRIKKNIGKYARVFEGTETLKYGAVGAIIEFDMTSGDGLSYMILPADKSNLIMKDEDGNLDLNCLENVMNNSTWVHHKKLEVINYKKYNVVNLLRGVSLLLLGLALGHLLL